MADMITVGVVGFGEVGGIFARDLLATGRISGVVAFDTAEPARARAEAAGLTVAGSAAEVASRSQLVFVSVTAGSALAAATSLAGGLHGAPLVVDVNSVSPSTKQAAARAVEAAGGRYVEAAVMTSVPPKGIASPMLLGGPHREALIELGAPLGMALTAYSAEIGVASSVKMCRSVMVKGLEALTTECMLAARHYGVEDAVLASMGDTLPHGDWPGLARYVISRALIHGKRRAEEMREVARTVEEAGIEPLLSRSIAERQDWAWLRGREMGPAALATTELTTLLDELTAAVQGGRKAAAD